ncbi:hypothetical protein ACWFMI_15545 [Nocardiopsis terrae]
MTELADNTDPFVFAPLFLLACVIASASASVLLRPRGGLRPRAAVVLVGTLLSCYAIAAIRPWLGWGDLLAYPPRLVLDLEKALSFSNAAEQSVLYGLLFVPLGIAVAAASRDHRVLAATALGFPLAIETAQVLLGTGRVASTLDYLSAGTGILLGIGSFLAVDAVAQRLTGSSHVLQHVEHRC